MLNPGQHIAHTTSMGMSDIYNEYVYVGTKAKESGLLEQHVDIHQLNYKQVVFFIHSLAQTGGSRKLGPMKETSIWTYLRKLASFLQPTGQLPPNILTVARRTIEGIWIDRNHSVRVRVNYWGGG